MSTLPIITDELLRDLIQRVVQIAHPTRIVLFGSAARNQMGPHSDLDLLVIVPDGMHRRETAKKIYRALIGIELPTDVVVVTERDVKEFFNEPSLVICPALKEGKELYRAS